MDLKEIEKELIELKNKDLELKLVYGIEENSDNPFGDKDIPVIKARLTYGYVYKDMFITSDKIYPLSLVENTDLLNNLLSIQKAVKEFEEINKRKQKMDKNVIIEEDVLEVTDTKTSETQVYTMEDLYRIIKEQSEKIAELTPKN